MPGRFAMLAGVMVLLAHAPMPALAVSLADGSKIERAQADVIECVNRMKIDTSWDRCRRLIFLPCEKHVVGSESHLGCLTLERNDWKSRIAGTLVKLEPRLVMAGREMLVASLGQWQEYVTSNCSETASKTQTASKEAAQLGCEISQYVGINADLTACLNGESGSPYCLLKAN